MILDLEDEAERWRALNESSAAAYIRRELDNHVRTARIMGLRIEITQVPEGSPRMGGTREIITVTPSRAGYQSTT